MRIGVDGRSLTGDAPRGVARVTTELLAGLAARFPQDEWRVLLTPGAGELPAGISAHRTRLPGRIMFGSAASVGRPRLDRLLGGVDVVWLPAPVPIAISQAVPLVLTLHDLAWVERPGDFNPYERIWHLLARPRSQAHRAARIAAVSEHTRKLAIDRWRVDPARITVVAPPVRPLGKAGATTERSGEGHGPSGERYFLWVGALEPRKAPGVLEQAWRIAHDRGLAARLVVVGGGRLSLTGPEVEQRGRVSDAELGALYSDAVALVMPSRLEGAGLTPLEAALQGTPSICSDLPPLRESLGSDGAEWVPPGDSAALAEALLRIAADSERCERIAAAAHRAATLRVDPQPAVTLMRTLLGEAISG